MRHSSSSITAVSHCKTAPLATWVVKGQSWRQGILAERPQFHIEIVETGLNYGRYKAEPMDPGYGTTMGNALRRILLRSLEGVAVSRIRLDNVWHEFSTIPHVREDVTEIVLNLKRVRLKRVMDLNGEARAHLYVRGDQTGERLVTAGDVVWPAEVDIINPEQPLRQLIRPTASSTWTSGSRRIEAIGRLSGGAQLDCRNSLSMRILHADRAGKLCR